MSLASKSARGSLVTLTGQWARLLVQVGSTIVLSRLLTPEDFGVLAMVMAIVTFSDLIRDFGITSGAIQARTLTDSQQTSLLIVGVSTGLFGALLSLILAQPLASFYSTPQVASAAALLAAIPLLGGCSSQFIVDLSRNLRFREMAVADAGSVALGAIVAIFLAIAGFGYWSLIFMQLVSAVSRTLILGFLSKIKLRRPAPFKSILPILRFGRNLFLIQLLDFASRNADNILIGRYSGPRELGGYTRAYQLLMLPIQQINAPLTKVALPVLSRINEDQRRFSKYLLGATTLLTYSVGCVMGALFVCAPEVVRIALGSQWEATISIFRALALAGFLQALGYVASWMFMAMDRTAVHLKLSLVTKPLIVGSFFVGLPWGALGVSVAYSLVNIVTVPLTIYVACRGTFVDTSQMFLTIARPFMLIGVCCASLFLFRTSTNIYVEVVALLLALGAVLLTFAARSYRADYSTILSVARLLLRRHSTVGSLLA